MAVGRFATLVALATLAASAPAVEERQACSAVWYYDNYLNTSDINADILLGANVVVKTGLVHFAVLPEARACITTTFTRSVFPAPQAQAQVQALLLASLQQVLARHRRRRRLGQAL